MPRRKITRAQRKRQNQYEYRLRSAHRDLTRAKELLPKRDTDRTLIDTILADVEFVLNN
jgi:hypothetical protein